MIAVFHVNVEIEAKRACKHDCGLVFRHRNVKPRELADMIADFYLNVETRNQESFQASSLGSDPTTFWVIICQ